MSFLLLGKSREVSMKKVEGGGSLDEICMPESPDLENWKDLRLVMSKDEGRDSVALSSSARTMIK